MSTDGLRGETELLRRPADATEAGNGPEHMEVFKVHKNISDFSEILLTRIRLYQSPLSP
ncbi:hypothetical protein SDC9_200927 [bioreactor metagenome]|uniref:Uncharacterized protein n=1 Tax=bioreactor metagenome TaxID=1076179 RepID=A0A645J1D8_9ZZZZ